MKQIAFNNEKISKLVLGTVQFGLNYGIANIGGKPSQECVDSIIEYVIREGLNCFDTAQAYGNSETVLGKALGENSNFIISKLKGDVFEKNGILETLSSLNNLKVKVLYALLLHDSQLLYNWKEKHTSLVKELKNSGKIRYFGVSIYSEKDFELALESEDVDFIQIPFNLFDQRALSLKWFEKAKVKNKLIFIRSIFLQGLLLMDKNSIPDNLIQALPYLELIEQYCHEFNMTKLEFTLNYVNTVAPDALILFGCDNLVQAQQNIQTFNDLVSFDESTVQDISCAFKNISEEIYNPTKW